MIGQTSSIAVIGQLVSITNGHGLGIDTHHGN